MDKLYLILGSVAVIYIFILEYRLRAMGAKLSEAKFEAIKAQVLNKVRALSDDELKLILDNRLSSNSDES